MWEHGEMKRRGLLTIAAGNQEGVLLLGLCVKALLCQFPSVKSKCTMLLVTHASMSVLKQCHSSRISILIMSGISVAPAIQRLMTQKCISHCGLQHCGLQHCHLSWKKDKAPEFIITPQKCFKQFKDEDEADLFWKEALDVVDKYIFEMGEEYDVTLSINYGLWIGDATHAHVHVAPKSFEAVLKTLQHRDLLLARGSPRQPKLSYHDDILKVVTQVDGASVFSVILKKGERCFKLLEADGYSLQFLVPKAHKNMRRSIRVSVKASKKNLNCDQLTPMIEQFQEELAQ